MSHPSTRISVSTLMKQRAIPLSFSSLFCTHKGPASPLPNTVCVQTPPPPPKCLRNSRIKLRILSGNPFYRRGPPRELTMLKRQKQPWETRSGFPSSARPPWRSCRGNLRQRVWMAANPVCQIWSIVTPKKGQKIPSGCAKYIQACFSWHSKYFFFVLHLFVLFLFSSPGPEAPAL